MEEEDDDFYGGAAAPEETDHMLADDAPIKDEPMQDDNDEDDEDEDEDDDSDVEFTLEKPEGAKSEPAKPSIKKEDPTASIESKQKATTATARSETPVKLESSKRATSTAPPTAVRGILTYDGKEGKDFPEVRTSSIDVDSNPIWPGNGKPILEMDIDADLAEHSKPWRITGTDQTDYFNYGFDEYTWTTYCIKQRGVRTQIEEQKVADEQSKEQMKALLGMGDKPGANPMGMPPMGGMGGMPDMDQMMQHMMASGVNPANMDFNQFMQFASQNGGFPDQGNQGTPFQGQAAFESGANSASPAPGPGQGFQPPSGPSQGFGGGMDYGSQGMMQDGGGYMGGGGGGGRGGRGRGRRFRG